MFLQLHGPRVGNDHRQGKSREVTEAERAEDGEGDKEPGEGQDAHGSVYDVENRTFSKDNLLGAPNA